MFEFPCAQKNYTISWRCTETWRLCLRVSTQILGQLKVPGRSNTKDPIRVRLVICQRIPMACKHLFPDLRRRTRTRPKLGWLHKHEEGNAKISNRVEEKTSRRPPRTYQSVSQFLFELKNCIVQSLPLKKLILCTLLKQDKLWIWSFWAMPGLSLPYK